MRKSTLLAVMVIVLCSIVGILFPSCASDGKASSNVTPFMVYEILASPRNPDSTWLEVYRMRTPEEAKALSDIARLDTARWNEFTNCINLPGNGGDASCDSCFIAVYGYSLEFK